MTGQDVTNVIGEVQNIGDLILAEIEALDPAVEVPASVAGKILDLAAQMATKAITTLIAANATVVNAATIASLAPDPTPLTPPAP